MSSTPSSVTVGGAVAHPAAVPEPDVRLSPHPAPQYVGPCQWHAPAAVSDLLVTPLGRLVDAPLELVGVPLVFQLCVFQSSVRCFPIPLPSHVPGLRQRIPGITQGLCFLGHPSHRRLRMVSCSSLRVRATDGFPRSVYPFSVTTGRCSTPCPSQRADATR